VGRKEELTSALVDDMDVCIVCKRPRQQVHHIFGKYNLNKSTEYKYILPLCEEHHTGKTGVHKNHQMDVHFKQMAQRHFEQHHGSRKDFIELFGKSWL
jgi:hypothetical protein